MEAGTYAAPAEHYEATAEFCAKQGYWDPMLVKALVNVHPEVLADIEANPHEWERRVRDYMYGLSQAPEA